MNKESTNAIDPKLILASQVAQGVSVIGDRWGFIIIRDVFLGVRQFEGFRRRNNIARGTLASRLKSLVANGILYKHPYQTSPTRYEYRLTEKGLDMYPVLLMSWDWETRWGRASFVPPELTHTQCGKSMRPLLRCGHCHENVQPQDVRFSPGKSLQPAIKIPPRHQRRSKSRAELPGGDPGEKVTLLDIVGDRWTSLVLAAAFFGLQRFDDISSAIGIATNILADRLKLLVQAGVLDRVPYQDKPVRHEYHLSPMGRDLYSRTVATHEWANRWLVADGEEPLILRHKPCGKLLHTEIVCDQCEHPIEASEVSFDRDELMTKAV